MTDRPIIFSGPMVNALIYGRKTQTRRVAASPLRRVEVGDRLWVRENFWWKPHPVTGLGAVLWQAHAPTRESIPSEARDGWRLRPSIHLPRFYSRITLIVESVKVEPLMAIDWDDAVAEGFACLSKDGGRTYKYGIPDIDGEPGTDDQGWPWPEWRNHPAVAYSYLWSQLHDRPGQRWADNPDVVALTFRVVRENVDQVIADA